MTTPIDTTPDPVETPAPPKLTEFDYANKLERVIGSTKCVGERWFHYESTTGVWREGTKDIWRPKALGVLPTGKRSDRMAQALLRHLESRWQDRIELFKGAVVQVNGTIYVNVLNGVLAVTPGSITLLPHDVTRYFTRGVCVAYDPNAQCPLFLRTLAQSLPHEADQQLLLLSYGNFLLPDCRHETATIGYGEAGSGKSTLTDPLTPIFGTEADGLLTRLSMKQICDVKSYSLPKLHYACVNLGTELQSIQVEDSANFKTLVSGEPIEARPIYAVPFVMQPHCKLMFLANNLPRLKNGTDAELRRIKFLHFQHKPTHPDVTLKARVQAEAPGLFKLMVDNLQKLLTIDRIPMGSAYSQSVHTRFQVSNDPLGTFVRRHCRIDPEASTDKRTMATSYLAYCQMHDVSDAVNDAFFRMLYERYPMVADARTRVDGKNQRMVRGIALLPDAPMDIEHKFNPLMTDNV